MRLKLIIEIFLTVNLCFHLARWAKETSNLQPWQRSLAFSLGRLAANSKSPSYKQANQGMKILQEAEQLGFKYTNG